MHPTRPSLLLTFLPALSLALAGPPHLAPLSGLQKRTTQLSCSSTNESATLFSGFDALCVAASGTAICSNRLSTCCQLSDGKTPYTCGGMDYSHCCGTDKAQCGADPSCKNAKGERDVQDAEEAVKPETVDVKGTATAAGALATQTAEGKVGETGKTGGVGLTVGKGVGMEAWVGMGVVGWLFV